MLLSLRAAFFLVSFVIAYFLGLTYAVLRAGTYFGLVLYALLLLAAVGFGIFAVRYKTRLGTAFLMFFNSSQLFVLCVIVADLLNILGIFRIPLNYVDFFAAWNLPFGLFVVLNMFRYFGFRDRKLRYFFLAQARDTPPLSGTD
jgi:hypothetical protein